MAKKCALVLLACLLLFSACGAVQADEPVLSAPPTIAPSETQITNRIVRISVTQMLADSPMFRQICDLFESQTGYKTELSANADSVAVSVAETGKMDVLIARDGTEASRFKTAGYSARSFAWVRDTLVLAGPSADPAAVSSADTLTQAFVRIAKSGSPFVSCYDDSDLNRIETQFWAQAGVTIGNGKSWYRTARRALPSALQTADSQNAYILSTLEAFLEAGDSLHLHNLLRDLNELHNTYLVMPVSSDAFPLVNRDGADAFCAFLQSEQAIEAVLSYGTDRYGSPIYEEITISD